MQIDIYKSLTGASSRYAVINEIIEYYFSAGAGISPAMQQIALKAIKPQPLPENPNALIALLTGEATDEEVARAIIDGIMGVLAHQIAAMRAMLRDIEGGTFGGGDKE